MPVRKKSGNLSYAPRTFPFFFFVSLYWTNSPIFSTSLVTIHFHFFSALAHPLRIGPNVLTISSSCHHGRKQLDNCTVHLFSVNLVTYAAQWNFCFQHSTITFFYPLRPWITSIRICSCNLVPNMDLSMSLYAVTILWTSFYVVYHFSLAYSIAGKHHGKYGL